MGATVGPSPDTARLLVPGRAGRHRRSGIVEVEAQRYTGVGVAPSTPPLTISTGAFAVRSIPLKVFSAKDLRGSG